MSTIFAIYITVGGPEAPFLILHINNLQNKYFNAHLFSSHTLKPDLKFHLSSEFSDV